VTQRIAEKAAPPMRCMTCGHSLIAFPGFLKHAFGPNTIAMALCPTSTVLPLAEPKQHIYARLGGDIEIQSRGREWANDPISRPPAPSWWR
jgi:hypothetical protein